MKLIKTPLTEDWLAMEKSGRANQLRDLWMRLGNIEDRNQLEELWPAMHGRWSVESEWPSSLTNGATTNE